MTAAIISRLAWAIAIGLYGANLAARASTPYFSFGPTDAIAVLVAIAVGYLVWRPARRNEEARRGPGLG